MQAETDYCHNVLENTEHLQEELYREMRGRIQEADQSAPVR
jgi:protease II